MSRTYTPPPDPFGDPTPLAPEEAWPDLDLSALRPRPAPIRAHEHEYAETQSERALALGYPSRRLCRVCAELEPGGSDHG